MTKRPVPPSRAEPAAMKARDIDSPERLTELFWHRVIRQWGDGNKAPLAAALRDKSRPIVGEEIREFLADHFAGGTVSENKGGHPEERYPSAERALAVAVFEQQEKRDKNGKAVTQEKAMDAVAQARRLSFDQVRGVVQKLRKAGFTFENWKTWVRLNKFTNT